TSLLSLPQPPAGEAGALGLGLCRLGGPFLQLVAKVLLTPGRLALVLVVPLQQFPGFLRGQPPAPLQFAGDVERLVMSLTLARVLLAGDGLVLVLQPAPGHPQGRLAVRNGAFGVWAFLPPVLVGGPLACRGLRRVRRRPREGLQLGQRHGSCP